MSIGNTKDQGNKGNNFPYQLRTLQLLSAINDSINALPGVDYETRTSTFQAIANGTGYSIGDIIVRYDIINLATSTVTSTIWFNETLQTIIAAPPAVDITPISAPSSATIINTVANPVITRPLDCSTDEVGICSDGIPVGAANPMPIDNSNLDTPLSDIYNNVVSKMARISGAGDYNRAIAYVNASGGDFRVSTVTHTGTTALGGETIIETFTYYPATDNVTNIQYT